jgi:hypothetical protein
MPKLSEATTVKQRITGIINEFTTVHLAKLLSDAALQQPYAFVFSPLWSVQLQSTFVDAPC